MRTTLFMEVVFSGFVFFTLGAAITGPIRKRREGLLLIRLLVARSLQPSILTIRREETDLHQHMETF